MNRLDSETYIKFCAVLAKFHRKKKYSHWEWDSLAIRLEICQPSHRIYANSKTVLLLKRTDNKKPNRDKPFFSSLRCMVFMSATNQNDFLAFIKLFAICVLSLSSSPSLLLFWLQWIAFGFYLFQSRSSYLIRGHHHRHCRSRRCRPYLVHAISDSFYIAIQDCNSFVYRTIITSSKWMPHCC